MAFDYFSNGSIIQTHVTRYGNKSYEYIDLSLFYVSVFMGRNW